MGERFSEIFLQLYSEINSDMTIKLRLKGKEQEQRHGMRIVSCEMEKMVKFCKKYRAVNEINLSYNEIGDDGLEILSNTLFSDPNNLKHINLMSCDITAEGMHKMYIASSRGFLKLKTLRLTGNPLGPMGGYWTAQIVQDCPTLQYLDVGDTSQTYDSIDCLFNQIYRSDLKNVNISRVVPNHHLHQLDDTFLAESISILFDKNNTLVEFHAQKCEFDAHDVETMIEGFKFNTSLKLLDLGYNNICCVGLEFLSDWIKTRPNLLGLNVAGNNIKNHGAIALSFAMPFSKLRLLDLSYNHVENEGIIAILNSIKKPYMLRYFYFWGNSFSHAANKIIERMIRSKVFQQENIDVKVYCVDGVLYAARYPADHYKHKYYDVMDHGCAVELLIKKNYIEEEGEKPRALIKFEHYNRFPPLEIKRNKKLNNYLLCLCVQYECFMWRFIYTEE